MNLRLSFKNWSLLLFVALLNVAPAQAAPNCQRLVSLAPSISVQLKQLDLAQQIVATTHYDQVIQDPALLKLGGYLDFKAEDFLKVTPSLVIGLREHHENLDLLRKLGLETLEVDHNRLTTYLNSYETIGKICSKQFLAKKRQQKLIELLNTIKKDQRLQILDKKTSVLILSAEGGNSATSLYALGENSFLSDLLPYFRAKNWQKNSSLVSEINTESLINSGINKIFVISSKSAATTKNDLPRNLQLITSLDENDVITLSDPGFYIPGYKMKSVLQILAQQLLKE